MLEAFARWREEKRVEWAHAAGRQFVVVMEAAAADAGLSADDRIRLAAAIADRMERVSRGDDEWLTGESGEVWVGPARRVTGGGDGVA